MNPSHQAQHSSRKQSVYIYNLRQNPLHIGMRALLTYLIDIYQYDLVRGTKVYFVLRVNDIGDAVDDIVPLESIVIPDRRPNSILYIG